MVQRNAFHAAGSDGTDGIAEVVQPWQGEGDPPHLNTLFIEVGNGAIAFQADGQGGEVHVVAALHGPPGIGLEVLAQDRIVLVGEQAAATGSEATHGGDQVIQIPVVIGVIQLKIGDHAQSGVEFDQGSVRFIGFRYQQSS